MRVSTIILTGLFLFSAAFASAQRQRTGVDLQKTCESAAYDRPDSANGINASYCLGLINGAGNMLALWAEEDKVSGHSLPPPICLPKRVAVVELVKVIVKYLNDHPEKLDEDESILLMNALHGAFPCKAAH